MARLACFRRGLATNLHALRVDDKTIQVILRHSNIGLAMNVYVKSLAESGINAMDLLGAALPKETCNNLAPNGNTRPNATAQNTAMEQDRWWGWGESNSRHAV
jgi:hypothetical protein